MLANNRCSSLTVRCETMVGNRNEMPLGPKPDICVTKCEGSGICRDRDLLEVGEVVKEIDVFVGVELEAREFNVLDEVEFELGHCAGFHEVSQDAVRMARVPEYQGVLSVQYFKAFGIGLLAREDDVWEDSGLVEVVGRSVDVS